MAIKDLLVHLDETPASEGPSAGDAKAWPGSWARR